MVSKLAGVDDIFVDDDFSHKIERLCFDEFGEISVERRTQSRTSVITVENSRTKLFTSD